MTILVNQSLLVKAIVKTQSTWMGMRIMRSSSSDCQGKKPVKPCSKMDGIGLSDVTAAAFRVRERVRYTPVTKSHMSKLFDMEIYQKVELVHHTGSFKERGVVNKLMLLPMKVKERGIVTATLDNFGLAMSYHCLRQGIPVTLVMPATTPMTKVHKCEAYKAKVLLCGEEMDELQAKAAEVAESKKLTLLQSADDYQLMAGYGTMALEMMDQVPDLDAVIVPVGSGSLLAGIVTAIKGVKPKIQIYGVESEASNSLSKSLETNIVVTVERRPTLADGLSVSSIGQNAFSCLEGKLHKVVTVSEDWIARAILQLAELQKLVIEGAGAIGAAAIMAGLVPELKQKKVMIILTGGNIDIAVLSRVLDRGMVEENRLVKFKVTTQDRIASLAKLAELIASIGVMVREYSQQRSYTNEDIYSTRIRMVCETRNEEHTKELEALLQKHYTRVVFGSPKEKKCEPC